MKSDIQEIKDQIKEIPLSQIYIDPDWNSRSKTWLLETEKGNDTTGQSSKGFLGLKQSIADEGQDTPVMLRPRGVNAPWEEKSKLPYALVYGFRRCEAIAQIAREGGSKWVQKNSTSVKAITRWLSEEEAQALNLRENVEREPITIADLAWACARLSNECYMTQKDIASKVGLHQSYVGLLISTVNRLDPRIAKAWREQGAGSMTLSDMKRIAAAEDQQAEWKAIASGGKVRQSKATAWLGRCLSDARYVGKLFGKLAKEGRMEELECKVILENCVTVYIEVPNNKKINDTLYKNCMNSALEAFEKELNKGDKNG